MISSSNLDHLLAQVKDEETLAGNPDARAILTHLLLKPSEVPPTLTRASCSALKKRLESVVRAPSRVKGGARESRTNVLNEDDESYFTLKLEDPPFPGPEAEVFKFIDLFAGIGGFRIAFQGAGGRCVFTSEWDKFAKKTYERNFGEVPFGDITRIDEKQIPKHDVLCAGFPCQPFSLAGVSKKNSLGRKHGFEDETQGTLFFDIARILEIKRPKAFLLENVKNLVSHDKGRTFQVILKTLRELGYKTVEHKVISSAPFVPQKRERIFIAGFLEETPFNFSQVFIPDTAPTLASILHSADEKPEEGFTETFRGKTRVLKKYTLTDKLWEYLENYGKAHKVKGNGFGCSVVGPDDIARTLSARYYKDGSEILIRQKGKNPRMLTPRECARLMGYDQGRSERMKLPVSNVQAYKQMGNGVCVPVIEAIANAMIPHLTGTFDASAHPTENEFSLT